MESIYPYFFAVARWICAFLSLSFIISWYRLYKTAPQISPALASLSTSDGININIYARENILGRGKKADIMIPVSGVLNRHAIIFFQKGSWFLAPCDGKISINLQNVSQPAPLEYGDKIGISDQTLVFKRYVCEDISSVRRKRGGACLFVLSAFQLLVGTEILLKYSNGLNSSVILAFIGLILCQWIYFLIGRLFENFTMICELPVLYLSTIGLAICSCHAPGLVTRQALYYIIGFALFAAMSVILRFSDAVFKLQRVIMLCSLALLYITAIFGVKINSSKNWLKLGPISFQPSEFVKVAFVVAGAATLYTIVKKPARQLEFFIYSVLCMGALAIMLDFGAVAIFFIGMITILTIRLVNPFIIGGICGASVLGAAGVILIYPYIAKRFSVWLHAFEYADSTGYQQTRTMIASASGGLLGVGGGQGKLSKVSAAETDLVFGIIGEEWGGICALTAALCIVALAMYAYKLAKRSDSMYHRITVSAAAAMILFQSALNIFGSLDLLPLTGVTLIFVSRGGSSLIATWMMMSFFKAAELQKKPVNNWGYEE